MSRKNDVATMTVKRVESVKEPRQSNIELLRIFAIMGVIVLHYNNVDMGGAFKFVIPNTVNQYVLLILESIFICAVDLFILITGYFLSVSYKRNLIKPLQLIVQVIIFSAGMYIVRVVMGSTMFSLKSLVGSLIPNNYFVILYIALYFVSPYINLLFKNLSEIKRKQFIIILILLFSVWPFLVDLLNVITKREWFGLSTIGAYGSQWGYSIVNFILLYCMGAYFRTIGIKDNQSNLNCRKKNSTLILIGILVLLIILIMLLSRYEENVAWEYCSPLVIAEAVVIFLLFSKLKVGSNKIINRLAKAAFSVFLLHTYILMHFDIEYFVQQNIAVMLGHLLFTMFVIYFICWIVHQIYNWITEPIYRMLATKISFFIDLDD